MARSKADVTGDILGQTLLLDSLIRRHGKDSEQAKEAQGKLKALQRELENLE